MTSIIKSFLFVSLVFLSQISFAQYNPIKEKKIDEKSLDKATLLAEKLMNGMKDGNFYLLNEEEATSAMVKGLTEDTQKKVYERVKGENGDFSKLNFIEALQPENDKSLTIYRYRGEFETIKEGPEIRVVMNKELQIAGFWILPWRDDIQGP